MRLITLLYALYVLIWSSACFAQSNTDKFKIHVISSYNPDTRKTEKLISTLSEKLSKNNIDPSFIIKSMNIGPISEANTWTECFDKLAKDYTPENTDVVIVTGQEAWAASLSAENMHPDIPVFVVSASNNGLYITPSKSADSVYFSNNSVNLAQEAKNKHKLYGGYLSEYNLEKNIELAQRIFPNTKNIAFLSDFSYGGKSIKALVKDSESKFENINFSYIDAQYCITQAQEKIMKLDPSNTVILVGTWRKDGEDQHFVHTSLKDMLKSNPTVPVFSITGSEIGMSAIGGYIPDYDNNEEALAQQILDFKQNDSSEIKFELTDNHYFFNKELLNEFGIKEYNLPTGSDIYSSPNEAALRYKKYTLIILIFSVLLIIVFTIVTIALMRITILKNDLETKTEELIAAKEKAEQSDKMKSAFLANMSHEIRTPLNAIVGFSEILCEENIEQDEAETFREIISQNSTILLSLIDDILDLSRLESSDTKFDKTDFSVNQLCEASFSSTKFNYKTGVKAIYHPASNDCIIASDYRRLTQVLTNLLNNASKFTDNGYIKLSYSIDPNNDYVYFSVEDTGCGIPRNKHKDIFQRFEKGNEFMQGAGLGLAICSNILKRLDSEIWIDSKYTSGSRFVFKHKIKHIKETSC